MTDSTRGRQSGSVNGFARDLRGKMAASDQLSNALLSIMAIISQPFKPY